VVGGGARERPSVGFDDRHLVYVEAGIKGKHDPHRRKGPLCHYVVTYVGQSIPF